MESLDLLLKYPLIAMRRPDESDVVIFEGKIFVENRDYNISVKQITIAINHHKYALELLENTNDLTEINQMLEDNNDIRNIVQVLDTIKEYIVKIRTKSMGPHLENNCSIYRKVLYEYSEFTKFFLNLKNCYLKEDLSKIFVSILDDKRRKHSTTISVNMSKNATNIFYISSHDLPKKDQSTDLFKPHDSLTVLFDQYLAQLEFLQAYFDVMDEFDRNCSILDPDNPKKKDCYRRIWMGENVSIIVTVDPYNIFVRPDIKFLGPNRLVEPYRTRLNENLGNWNCQGNIFQGILDLLGLQYFPKRESQRQPVNLLVEYGECSICFCLRLNEKLPEIICKNKSCEHFYHNDCLYDWLLSLNARRIFNDICGKCPNCEKTITCSIPSI